MVAMFTGIIAVLGTVVGLDTDRDTDVTRLTIDAGDLVEDLAPGGSLAVNGVCLTSAPAGETPAESGVFVADLMGETLARTTLGTLRVGSRVNLERCVPAGGRLDGHVVQGHVDATGTVARIEPQGAWTRMRIAVPARLAGHLAEKGSVAVDGISLTVAGVSAPMAEEHWFEVGLIPATLATTTLGAADVGDPVNLETDVLAKYTARLLAVEDAEGSQGAAGPGVGADATPSFSRS